ncbi:MULTISPECIES: hypothetical protein [Methylorubrum]|uniref:hypothetical protein n=1 Tax=Methylorubrum TaxID=2282523 RepID=UPI0020A138EC|nr:MULTISPECIES: hypothetical protein [Methylorubrum]MCP1550708.1 ATP-dependent HslUV protease subunit HslV [Methylorubrum zatmanii]MCP1552679.1 ATP-dependent HslUV protease subunit HslV [Methylorubrum extorquens]MCP1581011.1 ATP-dependent HslUV protease subunit HslV [Methylorubrum extorquens]
MTVIAYRNGTMAADSGAWYGEASHGWARKLARGADGALYGCAGSAAESEAFLRWVDEGEQGDMPGPRSKGDDDSSFIVLRVRPGGPVELVTAHGVESYDAPYFAIGAAAVTAFGALFMGATAAQAIQAALAHGPNAFGEVRTISR